MTGRAAPTMTEAHWQRRVTDLAELRSWSWAHFRPAETKKGWRTPVSGPLGAGFPDLIMLRGNRLLVIELKSDNGVLGPEQAAAIRAFAAVERVDSMMARPADWGLVQKLLA